MVDVQPYLLVEFVQEGKNLAGSKAKKSIDIIPSNWVLIDLKDNVSCKFMAPPYSADDLQALEDFVKQRADPPTSWPLWPIKIKGYASLFNIFYLILKPRMFHYQNLILTLH